jgi:hypothetical protein
MNFEELLGYESPEGFADGAVYWQFTLSGLNPPELKRQGDTGHYAHDERGCSRTFKFGEFQKFREAYIAAHEENIRRLTYFEPPILEIGPMISTTWPPWGKDNCG